MQVSFDRVNVTPTWINAISETQISTPIRPLVMPFFKGDSDQQPNATPTRLASPKASPKVNLKVIRKVNSEVNPEVNPEVSS
jgi:hypothetical protein